MPGIPVWRVLRPGTPHLFSHVHGRAVLQMEHVHTADLHKHVLVILQAVVATVLLVQANVRGAVAGVHVLVEQGVFLVMQNMNC